MFVDSSKVELLDTMGDDLTVVNTARVSFDKKSDYEVTSVIKEVDFSSRSYTETPIYDLSERDKKLIQYLAKHGHWSPFAHCFMSFRLSAPIIVVRQLAKHQVGLSWNEVSRRYVDTPPQFYAPLYWRGRAENAKQGSSKEAIDILYKDPLKDGTDPYWELCHAAMEAYKHLLNRGVAPEMARMVLPQSMMTEWIWSGSMMAFARVCKQRLDSHAQQETADVARQINYHAANSFPYSWAALMEN